MEAAAQLWPCPSYGVLWLLLQRKTIATILRICKNLPSTPERAQLTLPRQCLPNSLQMLLILPLNTIFIKVHGVWMEYEFGAKFCFVLFWEESHHVEKHLIHGWAPPSKQHQSPAGWSTRPQHSPGTSSEYLGSSFLCDRGASIWPRISWSQGCTLSDTAISWFLSTVPLFSLSLCLHSELSYVGAEPASFSDYIWIYSHRLSLYFEGKLDQICSFLLLLVLV